MIEHGDLPVGALGVAETDAEIFLSEIQILPEWQNRGIGTKFLASEIERARRLDKPLRLRVLRENSAKRLYERHGFVVSGETETHLLMALRLDSD